jgi:hypothetical protein
VKTYVAHVTREGKWWMVAIPEIDGLTQARRLSEAELMAREYIALSQNVALDGVRVDTVLDAVGAINVVDTLAEIRKGRAQAAALEAESRRQTEQLARQLAEAHVPVRDIGTMMGVSFQRAHQLVAAHK